MFEYADLQGSFIEFLNGITSSTEESLTQSIEQLDAKPEIARTYARQSAKFVEIFSRLRPGEAGNKVASLMYTVVSKIMTILSSTEEDREKYFGQLQYIADLLIRRHIPSLYQLMGNRRGELAVGLLVQVAKVDSNHCRDLFYALNFASKEDDLARNFKNQATGKGRKQYVELATVFLENQEISFHFLGSKYYISSIWKKLAEDDHDVARNFLKAMRNAIKPANPGTKRWVFNELALKEIAKYPFDSRDNKTAQHEMYLLLQTVLSGPESMIVEDPKRVYCKEVTELESESKNKDLLKFIRDLDPWKKPSHRDLVLFIFEQSPDLIARYMMDKTRSFNTDVSLPAGSALVFISSVIAMDWPEFLKDDVDFFEEGRSLSLLFESILPSMLKNSYITGLLKKGEKDGSVLMAKEMMVILANAIRKFQALPDFLKQGQAYTKLRGRLALISSNGLIASCASPVLAPYALKLLLLLDQVFPFFISDSVHKEQSMAIFKDIANATPHMQMEIMRIIPQLPLSKVIEHIPVLCSLIHDDRTKDQMRLVAFESLMKIASVDDVFEDHMVEVPIWIGEALENVEKGGNDLKELITLVRPIKSRDRYVKDNTRSLCYNAISEKNCLGRAKAIIDAFYEPGNVRDLDLSPTVILSQMKWFSYESTVILLCASLARGFTDVDYTLDCLRMVVSLSPRRTLPYVLNHPFIRGIAFSGSESIDRALALFIQMNQGCDDNLAHAFINGTVIPEVAEIIAPFIKATKPLIKKLLGMNLSIRNIITSDEQIDLSHLSPFWQWAFKDFVPIDLSKIWPGLFKKIDDELVILNIMRTMYIKNDATLLPHIVIPETTNKRLHVMGAVMLPEQQHYPDSLPVCFITDRQFNNAVVTFEKTHKTWAYEYLLQQIRKQPFTRTAKHLSEDETKIRAACVFLLSHPGDVLIETFKRYLAPYFIKYPEIVEKPPKAKSVLFDEVMNVITRPENLVEYTRQEQFEGIVNIILGAPRAFVTLRTVLYLSTHLATSPSFYAMLEAQKPEISGPSFLFATGEVARIAIETIDNGQKLNPHALFRNPAYLKPFHKAHQNVQVDTPMFRFLLHFANHLLTTLEVAIDVFMKSGALSIIMKALSSKDEHTRAVAYATLSSLYDMNLKNKEWAFYNQLSIVLESLLNAVDVANKRFSPLISYFLACASSIIMKPSHTIFMMLIRFLIATPALRCGSVPLFNDLFGSDSTDYRSERTYILEMMKIGITEEADAELVVKGRVVERLIDFFASPLADRSTRHLILDVLKVTAKFVKLPHIIMWVFSIMNESFATFHLDKLIDLALSTKGQSEAEKHCCTMIAREAADNLREKVKTEETKNRILAVLDESPSVN